MHVHPSRSRAVRAGSRAIPLLVVLAVAIAACYTPVNAPTPTPSGATLALPSLPPSAIGTFVPVPTDPCSLLTLDQLQRATAETFTVGGVLTSGSAVACDWPSGDDSVTLTIKPLDPTAFSTGMATQITSPNVEYPAYLDASNTLHAAKNGLDVAILTVLRAGPSAGYQAGLTLMPQVLSKL